MLIFTSKVLFFTAKVSIFSSSVLIFISKVLDLSDCPSAYEQLPPTAGCLFREAAGIREELSTAFQVAALS